MSHRNRVVVPGLPHHLTQRGNNRMPVFRTDEDFLYCLYLIGKASSRYNCQVHAYVLMTNHFHLLATPEDNTGMSRMMQSIESRYVRYFNRSYERTGTMWEGRFGSSVVESGRYFFTACRYIEMNPVRALLAPDPSAYRWSSFHCNAAGKPDALITPHSIYLSLSDSGSARLNSYSSLFADHLDDHVCQGLRMSTQKNGVFGSEQFVDDVEQRLKRPVRPLKRGGAPVAEEIAGEGR